MNTKQEIVKIINSYDFIIIPGLGAFQGMYSKPYFNAVGDIVPAQRKLQFEPIIKKDIDNKLFQLLVERIDIPKNLILIEYSDFIDKLNLELNNTGKYDFEGLGSFFKLSDGTISFYGEQSEEKKSKAIISEPIINEIIPARLPEPILNLVEKTVPAPIFEEVESDNHKSKQEFIKSMETTKPFKVLLYMIPFFLLLAGLSYAVFFKSNEKTEQKPSMMAEIDSLSKLQDELNMEPVYKADPPIQESTYSVDRSTPEISSPIVEEKVAPVPNNEEIKDRSRGKIIPIGVFSSRETADNVVSKFAENGVPARTKAYKGKFKVFVVSYSDSQSDEFKQKIQDLNSILQ